MYPTKNGEIIIGGGMIKLYDVNDIQQIEGTEEYRKSREKADRRRRKTIERKRMQEEQRRLEEERKLRELKELAKLYEEVIFGVAKSNTKMNYETIEWQENCSSNISNKTHVILSSPTGSGKTRVFLEWALKKSERPIFITAPTKAVSNQRYRELKKLGYLVGIETGDIKNIPTDSEFICCTQEIYTNKYINIEKSTLIIDEFNYIFENHERARTYIDALKGSKSSNILISSATLGNAKKVKDYIDRVTNMKFYLYENDKTLTELVYMQEIDKKSIMNALVIAFSMKKCNYIADTLSNIRSNIIEVSQICKMKYLKNYGEIKEAASKYNINIDEMTNKDYIKYGVAVYYSSLLPSEKFFIEKILEERLIDTLIGTDALALGVNFPIQNVVFTQLVKNDGSLISKNLFEQISGRAGRKGYFEKGQVFYCSDLWLHEKYWYNISELYQEALTKKNEDISIVLSPCISKILKEITTIEDEAKYIVEYSTEKLDIENVKRNIKKIVGNIGRYNIIKETKAEKYSYYMNSTTKMKEEDVNNKELQIEFNQNISEVYFDEYDWKFNCDIFRWIIQGENIEQILKHREVYFQNFNNLLQFRIYIKRLPRKYRKNINISTLEEKINNIDKTVLNIEYYEKFSN